MKHKYTYTIIFAVILLFSRNVQASWFIDQERFQGSHHGALSCVECHPDIDTVLHPNPEDVNKRLSDFFSADVCSDCHDAIEDYVAAGSHGGKPVNEPADIENCLACHNPHYGSDAAVHKETSSSSMPAKNAKLRLNPQSREKLAPMDEPDEACMACHRMNAPDQSDALADALGKTAKFCLYCHGDKKSENPAGSVPLIDAGVFKQEAHKGLSCLACHPDAPEFGHSNQIPTDCLECHSHHDESTIHDAHVNVTCQACHLGGVKPVRDNHTNRIGYQKENTKESSTDIHRMKVDADVSCLRCHYSKNALGASAMVLPAKSFICMPCHTAVFSIDDPVSQVSLAVFFIGMFMLFFFVLSGRMESSSHTSWMHKTACIIRRLFLLLFSRKIMVIGKSFIMDSFLQQRLMVVSPSRWAIHGLIFYPFVIRFAWGLAALILSCWFPDGPVTRMMLDKNHPSTAILFDATGVMVLFGVALAAVLGTKRISAQFKDMPKQDWPAYLLLGGIVVIGFILEGMRIAMTGSPKGAGYSFLGYSVSRLFMGLKGLTEIYGYVWYAHAVCTGLFVAYLPFSRMLHMILAPFVMALNRIDKERK